ncbi:MAG: hypothetical protein AAF380_03470 [Bacteroidota bacterium]
MNAWKPTIGQKDLLDAISDRDIERVKYLVKKRGVDPNFGYDVYIDKNPIVFASLMDPFDIAAWLIDEGGAEITNDVARFVTNVVGNVSVSNHIHKTLQRVK